MRQNFRGVIAGSPSRTMLQRLSQANHSASVIRQPSATSPACRVSGPGLLVQRQDISLVKMAFSFGVIHAALRHPG